MPVIAPPPIDALPLAPDPDDRSTFNPRAYAWSAALQPFSSQIEAVAENVVDNALEAQAAASLAGDRAATATTKATEAGASAANAAGSLSGFRAVYLGAAASDPTADGNGNALTPGGLYFNTVANEMRVWNATASVWQPVSAIPERSFIAAAGQTSYTFVGGYRVGATYVWVNGALLDDSDIVATNGTTITFNSPLALNDEVRILSFMAISSMQATYSTGDIVITSAALEAPDWLPADGSIYFQSNYPALFAQIGLLPDSRAGRAWTLRASGGQNLRAVTHGNGLFVAVGDSGTILTSPDTVTWTPRTSGVTATLRGVAFGNGLFVAVGDSGTILTSPNGVTWTPRSLAPTANLRAVAFGNGLFVAVGAGGLIFRSSDTVAWLSGGAGSSVDFAGVAFGNGLFVIVGALGTIFSGPDGDTWTACGPGVNATLRGVAFGNGLFVVAGDGFFSSRDAFMWTPAAGASTGVTFGNGLFVAVGSVGTLPVTSTNGRVWVSSPFVGTASFNAVTYGAGVYVTVGTVGQIVTSAIGYDRSTMFATPISTASFAASQAYVKT